MAASLPGLIQNLSKGPIPVVAALPTVSGKMSPLDQYTRGLEDMTNASLQRGRQAEGFCEAMG